MNREFSSFDKQMMRRCFSLARRGEFRVRPNPMVGAVLVKNGRIIGQGYHHYFGGPHAEVEAFKNATEDPTGATLYCNLEPCCHTNKKTPPCTPLVISKKVARVVVANLDPNPQVSGRGIQQMREAGIQVDVGLLEKEGAELNKVFFLNMAQNRPFITLKIARSLDGFIALERTQQTWLTGPKVGRFVHRLRARHLALLVGAGTILADDPLLTVRHVKGPQPWRLVLDGHLRVPLSAKLFHDRFKSRTIVLTAKDAPAAKVSELQAMGIQVVQFAAPNHELPLSEIISYLWQEKQIASLLVEGGQTIFTSFLNERLFDECLLIEAPVLLGRGLPAFQQVKGDFLQLKAIKKLDDDVALLYTKKEK